MLRPRANVVSALGEWALQPVPVQREAPLTARRGRTFSGVVFMLAAVATLAMIFGTLGDQTDIVPSTFVRVTTAPVVSTDAASAPVATEQAPPPTAVEAQRSTASAAAEPTVRRTVAPPIRARTDRPVTAAAAGGGDTAAKTMTLPAAPAVELLDPTALIGAVGGGAAALDPEARIRRYIGLADAEPLPPMFVYTIEVGDTLASIAGQFGLEEATLLFNNFDVYDPNNLVVGDALQLPTVDGVVYTVQHGDVLSAVVANYAANVEATLAYPGNRLSSPGQIEVGQTLVLVDGSASLPAAAVSGGSSAGSAAVSAAWSMPVFRWPLAYDEISDVFGVPRANRAGYHTGVDFLAAVGTIVGTTAAGQVSFAGWDGAYGYWVEVDHGGGVRSRYAHLAEIWVTTGEWLDALDFVGTVGMTGNTSGAHLHFEIIMQGTPVDPLAHLE